MKIYIIAHTAQKQQNPEILSVWKTKESALTHIQKMREKFDEFRATERFKSYERLYVSGEFHSNHREMMKEYADVLAEYQGLKKYTDVTIDVHEVRSV